VRDEGRDRKIQTPKDINPPQRRRGRRERQILKVVNRSVSRLRRLAEDAGARTALTVDLGAPFIDLRMRGARPGKPGRHTAAASRRTPHGARRMGSSAPRMFAGRSVLCPYEESVARLRRLAEGDGARRARGVGSCLYEEKTVASWASEEWARFTSPTNSGGKPPHSTSSEANGARDPWASSRQASAPGTTDPPGSINRRPGGPLCCAPTKKLPRPLRHLRPPRAHLGSTILQFRFSNFWIS
jgi:hypothetical protein